MRGATILRLLKKIIISFLLITEEVKWKTSKQANKVERVLILYR